MLTLSTATGKVHDLNRELHFATGFGSLLTLAAATKLACREIESHTTRDEAVVSLLDGDLADLGCAVTLLCDTLDVRRGDALMGNLSKSASVAFALADARYAAVRLCTRLQRLCTANPLFEDA
jgi:hypothetical protein